MILNVCEAQEFVQKGIYENEGNFRPLNAQMRDTTLIYNRAGCG